MWDSFLSIELDGYGFTINSSPFYLSLSWGFIAVLTGLIIARRFYLMRMR